MTATAKVNYTVEQTAKAVADYKAGVDVKAIAESLGKTVRSVIAKLSREGVYTKKEYVSKSGEKVETKAELVAQIAEKLNVTEDAVGSLEAATKNALKAVLAGL